MRVRTTDRGGLRGWRRWSIATLLALGVGLGLAPGAKPAAMYEGQLATTISVSGTTAGAPPPDVFTDAVTDPSPNPCCAASAQATAPTSLTGTLLLSVSGQTGLAGGGFASSQALASTAFTLSGSGSAP